ncbi:MAG TPA: hypothetical protein ENI05_07275 [Porticoccus sp.]|nr:hypothetical protein [Porticoccus sp.]
MAANGAVTATLVPHERGYAAKLSIAAVITGTVIYDIEMTQDRMPKTASPVWFTHDEMQGLNANANDIVDVPIGGLRGKITTYTSGTLSVSIAQEKRE